MLVKRTRKYQTNFLHILKYIAKDKISASENFKNELDELINNLPNFPHKYRESLYSDDKNVRDMTYKKYTIIYEVNLDKNTIDILNIFNKNKPL
jgi:plasmid stabilization system protein ParE